MSELYKKYVTYNTLLLKRRAAYFNDINPQAEDLVIINEILQARAKKVVDKKKGDLEKCIKQVVAKIPEEKKEKKEDKENKEEPKKVKLAAREKVSGKFKKKYDVEGRENNRLNDVLNAMPIASSITIIDDPIDLGGYLNSLPTADSLTIDIDDLPDEISTEEKTFESIINVVKRIDDARRLLRLEQSLHKASYTNAEYNRQYNVRIKESKNDIDRMMKSLKRLILVIARSENR